MARAWTLLLAVMLLAVPLSAEAQRCPSGAHRADVIAEGSRVKIVGLSPDDAYYPERAQLIGKSGRIDQLDSTGSCWFGGQFYGDDGGGRYFYQVAVEVLEEAELKSSCPPGAWTGAAPPTGTRVRLLAVSPDDAYYSTRYSIEGKTGRTDGIWSKMGEPCWFAGQFYDDAGTSHYFYQVALDRLDPAIVVELPHEAPGVCPLDASVAERHPDGARVEIAAIHPDDAYYSVRADVVGLRGQVDGDLHSNDGCWMGGGFVADDGSSYYFYKAAVRDVAVDARPLPRGDRFMGDSIDAGRSFLIVAVHYEDAYYSSRREYLGVRCHAVETLARQGPGWFSGQVRCDDGAEPYFYKVGLILE